MFNTRSLPSCLFALMLVVPGASAATFQESFASNPLQHGWKIFGQTNLFQWDSTNHNLRVTWDSSQSNSFFYLPIGTILSRSDDFSIGFDLRLTDIGAASAAKSNSFPICIGLLNLEQATRTNFFRGTGANSPNLAELAYFWDSGFGATTWPTFVDTNSSFNYNGASDYAVYSLVSGDNYQVSIAYTAATQTAITSVTNLNLGSGILLTQLLNTTFTDFRLGAVSVSSYGDAGQDPTYAGSVLSHGVVANLTVTVPPPPVLDFSGGWTNRVWKTAFTARTNWLYSLERTGDFKNWTAASPVTAGYEGRLVLSDLGATNSVGGYRVRAFRP